MPKTHMSTEDRKTSILNAALDLLDDNHYRAITRDELAEAADTSPGNVTRIFDDIFGFREQLVLYAIEQEHHVAIVQAVSVRDPLVKQIPKELQIKALHSVMAHL